MLQCFTFAYFCRVRYTFNARVSDLRELEPSVSQALEETVERQILDVELKQAVMACFAGTESRRWTVGELVERFKNLGISASRAGVTAALADLEIELQLASWAPWRLLERGTEWILAPKSELLELLSGVRKLPLKGELSDAHKAVLLVVIGHRRKGGVSKTRVGEILSLDAYPYLEDLMRRELIYVDPAREFNFWRPTQSALLALGFRSFADIPALKELEEWFESLERKNSPGLDAFFARAKKLQSRRLKRELERRQSIGTGSPLEGIPGEERSSDLLRRQIAPLPHPSQESPERVMQSCSPQGPPARSGEKEF
jgi:chromosome segregation and condensation protein ScpB